MKALRESVESYAYFICSLGKPIPLQLIFCSVALFLFGACAAQPSTSIEPPVELHTNTMEIPAYTLQPSVTWTITSMITSTPDVKISSPLQDVPLSQIPALIKNPYNPPPMGSDDHHQGIDIADLEPTFGYALEGRAVQAVIGGRVAGITADRFPYGSLMIIETHLEEIPPGWRQKITLPTPAPTPSAVPALTCPGVSPLPTWDSERRSLYLLYAHLQNPPAFQPGDTISSGQVIGAIGDSGNALNPHLHLEVRIGPAGTLFGEMVHYDPAATEQEMDAYCLWRVSGWFQVMDPLTILLLGT